MQVSDLFGQFQGSAKNTERLTGTKGVGRIVSSLREMSAGHIFEGTVNSIKNGQVVLGLSNGQEVTARLEGKVQIFVGQSMFFQVKSNDGLQIAIRPFTVAGNTVNLTLMDALKAASLPVDARNLTMVNAMMEEQMSIDRNSLSQVARLLQYHPEIDVRTIVQMHKLNIPVTEEFAAQFENYMDDKQAIGKALEDFMAELPAALSNEELPVGDLTQIGGQILSIMTEGLPEEVEEMPEVVQEDVGFFVDYVASEETEAIVAAEPAAAENTAETEAVVAAEQATAENAAEAGTAGAAEQATAENAAEAGTAANAAEPMEEANTAQNISTDLPHTLAGLLTKEGVAQLTKQLAAVIEDPEQSFWFANDTLDARQSATAVLNALGQQLLGGKITNKDALLKLFSGREFQILVKDALEQQWMVRPQDVKDKDQIGRLYERLESQLSRMEGVAKAAGQSADNLTQMAADIRSNVEFMNQINQAYTYVQIPLKMSGQNANGELYVYTNKKSLAEGKEDLTAFLHLDMDHLGSTDVSVCMQGKNIQSKFYFDNDESFRLVKMYLPKLNAKLAAKGYRCELSAVNEEKQVDFVEDFLKKDLPSAGMLHRYSFDMRA